VTRDSPTTTGQNGSRDAAERRKRPVADRVYARMEDMQPPDRDSAVDGARVHPELDQLPARDGSMLTLGEGGDRHVDSTRSTFATNSVVDVYRLPHSTTLNAAV
jgi:hypothetical protein